MLTSEGEYRENIEIPRGKGDMLETRNPAWSKLRQSLNARYTSLTVGVSRYFFEARITFLLSSSLWFSLSSLRFTVIAVLDVSSSRLILENAHLAMCLPRSFSSQEVPNVRKTFAISVRYSRGTTVNISRTSRNTCKISVSNALDNNHQQIISTHADNRN